MAIQVRKYKKKDGLPLDEIHSFETLEEAIKFVNLMNKIQLNKIESKRVFYYIPTEDFILYTSQPIKDPLKLLELISATGFPLNSTEQELLNTIKRKLAHQLPATFEEKYEFCVLFWQVKGWIRAK
jgi:hypothetical protein